MMKRMSRRVTGIWQRGPEDQVLVIIRATDGKLARVSTKDEDGINWEEHEHIVNWSDIFEVA